MGKSLVDRATSDSLVVPNMVLNFEICDSVNQGSRKAKDVIKGVKKRMGHKSPKVQYLALSLLESLMKNCDEVIPACVVERDVLKEMVKIAKKKKLDGRVKEKLLSLIDIWQEAFGGPLGKFPQFYKTYQDLLHAGFLFPERAEAPEAIRTPPQTRPNLQNYPSSVRAEHQERESQASAPPAEDLMSITEINNAIGIVDILTDMLNAIEPGNKGAVGQEVIVELVKQCHTNKGRVVKLVDSTTDEYMISKALALNDNLQKVLAQHDAIAAGFTVRDKSLPPPIRDDESSKQDNRNSAAASTSKDEKSKSTPQILALPAPPPKSTTTIKPPPTKAEPIIDLLSGDNYYKSESDQNSMALVPYDPNISASDQNVLALADMFADLHSGKHNSNQHSNNNHGPNSQANRNIKRVPSREPTFHATRNVPPQHVTQPHQRHVEPTFRANGSNTNTMALTVYDPNSQTNSSSSQRNGSNNQNGSLPPAPWEAVNANPFQDNQIGLPRTSYQNQQLQSYPVTQNLYPNHQPQPVQIAQPNFVTVVPQPVIIGQVGTLQPMGAPAYSPYQQIQVMPVANQPSMYTGHMQQMYVQNTYAYGYGNLYEATVQENVGVYQQMPSTKVNQQPNIQSQPKDTMFGDLVNMSKYKQSMSKKIGTS